MDRRDFLHGCGSACLWLLAAPLIVSAEGCSTWPMVSGEEEEGMVRVPFTSLRGGNSAIIRVAAIRDDLFLQRDATGTWQALLLRCTHRDQPLQVHVGGISCAAHGSRFDLNGRVITGPATIDLIRLPVTSMTEALLIGLHGTPST